MKSVAKVLRRIASETRNVGDVQTLLFAADMADGTAHLQVPPTAVHASMPPDIEAPTVKLGVRDAERLLSLARWAFSEVSEGTGDRFEALEREALERAQEAIDAARR